MKGLNSIGVLLSFVGNFVFRMFFWGGFFLVEVFLILLNLNGFDLRDEICFDGICIVLLVVEFNNVVFAFILFIIVWVCEVIEVLDTDENGFNEFNKLFDFWDVLNGLILVDVVVFFIVFNCRNLFIKLLINLEVIVLDCVDVLIYEFCLNFRGVVLVEDLVLCILFSNVMLDLLKLLCMLFL